MKKALLFLLLAAGAQQLKAQRQSIPDNLPNSFQLQRYQPMVTDSNYIAFIMPKASSLSNSILAVPNLQQEMDRAHFEQLLAESSTHNSRMPIARTQSDDKMPIHRAPDSIHYHMLISKPKSVALSTINP